MLQLVFQLTMIVIFPILYLIQAWLKFRADPTIRMFIGCTSLTVLVPLFWYIMAVMHLDFPESLRYWQRPEIIKIAAGAMVACLLSYFVSNVYPRKSAVAPSPPEES